LLCLLLFIKIFLKFQPYATGLMPKLPSRSVVILDNATFHKSETMKQNLEKQGHTLLYLPPYSPDLNPIEHKWAQAKAMRRKTNTDLNTLFQVFNL